jgi:hypothetical protein
MANKKNSTNVDLTYSNTDQEIKNIDSTSVIPVMEQLEPQVIEPEVIEPEDKNPLHLKYQKFIDQAYEGYLVGFEYPYAMEVLRYCESKKKIQLGLNMSCPTCLINLLKMFDNLRD